jgi:hypothetical protein
MSATPCLKKPKRLLLLPLVLPLLLLLVVLVPVLLWLHSVLTAHSARQGWL